MAPRKPTNVGTEETHVETPEVSEFVETPAAVDTDAAPDTEIPDTDAPEAPEGDADAPEGDAEAPEEDQVDAPPSWRITAPDDRTATVARVRFEDGAGHTTDPTRIAFFERRGWGVEEV